MTKKKRYRRYSPEFKKATLKRAAEEDVTDVQVCQELGIWFCHGLMDSFVSTDCPFLERHRADVTKIAIAAYSIIKTLDVFEYISSSLLPSSVANAIHSLSFQ